MTAFWYTALSVEFARTNSHNNPFFSKCLYIKSTLYLLYAKYDTV